MDEISRMFGTKGRDHSDSLSSDATQSTGSKLVLRHRLNQLLTCVDDLDPKNELHDKVVKTLDNAFLICGKRANKPKKDSFRWRTRHLVASLFCLLRLGRQFVLLYRNNGYLSPVVQRFYSSLFLFSFICS